MWKVNMDNWMDRSAIEMINAKTLPGTSLSLCGCHSRTLEKVVLDCKIIQEYCPNIYDQYLKGTLEQGSFILVKWFGAGKKVSHR